MKIQIVSKAKHGDISRALAIRGWSQSMGAQFLNMGPSEFSKLINLKWVPKEFGEELSIKLFELTGKTVEELFPQWARDKNFLKLTKQTRRFVEVQLKGINSGTPRYELSNPEEAYEQKELKRIINDILHKLSPKEELVLRGFMEGRSMTDISKELLISVPAVCRVKKRAIEKLKKPLHSFRLLPFVT